MLVTGPALHLWFLPFAFVVSVLVLACARIWISAGDVSQTAISMFLLGGTLLMLAVWPYFSHAGPPFAQWAYATPAVLLGLFIGANWHSPYRRTYVSLACILVLGTAVFVMHAEGSLQLAISSATILLCLYLPLPDSAAAHLCASTALTVYLVHPLVMSVLQKGLHIPPASLPLAVGTCTFSFAIAVALMTLKTRRQTGDSR